MTIDGEGRMIDMEDVPVDLIEGLRSNRSPPSKGVFDLTWNRVTGNALDVPAYVCPPIYSAKSAGLQEHMVGKFDRFFEDIRVP